SQFLFCTFLVDAAAVIDAFTWMQDIAEQDQKRLVINMSWGLHWIGTLDGNSLIGQAIEQFAQEGVVFVSSAGNNGDVNFHIKKAFEADTLRSRMQFYPYTANPNMWGQSISMWGEESGAFSAGFAITTSGGQVLQETPWYHTATQPTYLDSFMVQGVDTVFFNLTADAAHPLNGRPHFRLRVKNTSAALRITLKATADPGTVHFWNVTELSNDVGNWGQEFQAPLTGYTVGDRNYGISEPACTENLIAVAAYNSEYLTTGGNPAGGSPASFSSYGPTLDDRMKPDLAAPGVTVASSISSFTDNSFSTLTTVDFQGRTYPFGRFSGTSMSSPAVAGIVALLLQADPTLTPAEVREVLKLTARADQYTGVIPPGGSTRWGSGKVNAYRAIREVLGPISVDEITATGMMIWPNPTHDELNIGMNGIGKVEIIVQDLTGRIVHADSYTSAQLIRIDTRSWTTGMYIVRLAQGDAVSLAKVIKQ
ncbi:MAG: S8/S53 family peptidase, partial [Flavobacteriales bacterium]